MTEINNEPPARLVVNSNLGLTNVVNIEDSKLIICNTLKTCIEMLSAHCGPLARYAMLLNGYTSGEQFEPSVFTRDGIRILSAVEFVSPLERYVQDLLTYIGSRVDNYAKDGTTTSMLIAATFINELLNNNYDHDRSPIEVAREINTFISDLNKDVDLHKCTVDKIAEFIAKHKGIAEVDEGIRMEAASIVAYMQALSSSGGNIQLAECMRTIFASSPSISWDFISYQNNPKESTEPYSVCIPDYDVKFKCSLALANTAIFNKGLGTEYDMENIRCIVYSNGLTQGGIDLVCMIDYMNEYPADQPLLLVSPYIDPELVRTVDKLNQQRTVPISLWQYISDMRIRNNGLDFELRLANAVCGCEPFEARQNLVDKMSDKYTFVAKRVHFFGGYLHIYDTAPVQEGTCIHPYYLDKNKATSYYNDLREAIETQLDLYNNNARSEVQLRNYFVEILNRMACIHRPTLYVGGTVHEQVANADVVQDVLGAIMSSLKHGFYINGVWSFLDDVGGISGSKDTPVYQALHHAVKLVWDSLYQQHKEVDHYYTLDVGSYWNILSDKPAAIDDFIIHADSYAKNNNYPILHPIGIYTELLKRLNELAIRFALTDKIIVRGGVVVPEEEK